MVHGTLDKMITPQHGELLAKEIGRDDRAVTVVMVEARGHGLPMEWRRGLTKVIAAIVEKTEALQ